MNLHSCRHFGRQHIERLMHLDTRYSYIDDYRVYSQHMTEAQLRFMRSLQCTYHNNDYGRHNCKQAHSVQAYPCLLLSPQSQHAGRLVSDARLLIFCWQDSEHVQSCKQPCKHAPQTPAILSLVTDCVPCLSTALYEVCQNLGCSILM